MSIAPVTETSKTETTAATTITLAPGNVAGNALALWVGFRPSTVSISSVADTGGNTWNQAIQQSTGTWYVALNTVAAGTITVTFSASASAALSCLEFSGVATSSALDVTVGNNATSTSPATGTSAATAQAAEVVIAGVQQNNTSATFSAQTSGYTVETAHTSSTGQGLVIQTAYQILSATGTQSYGCTSSVSAAWIAALITLKAAPATPTQPLVISQAVRRAKVF